MQTIVNEALENGLALYEKRHPGAKGLIQGSVVVLRNADAAILAEAGGRQVYQGSLHALLRLQPRHGLAAAAGLGVEAAGVPGRVPPGPRPRHHGARRAHRGAHGRPIAATKWIANYDNQFKGPIPVRQALAESRNAVAVWITREIGVDEVIRTARELGIRTPLQPYITTALGASEVRLLELAGAYRAMASGILAEPHIIDRVTDASGERALRGVPRRDVGPDGPSSAELSLIQEGLRGVVRLPDGTAHALDGRDFPIPVMGKTGTTSDFRDALFVGSTYGPQGITVAVRIGFDDNRALGDEGDRGRARRCRSSARSCSASTRTSWWGRCRGSPARSRRGSTSTWRRGPCRLRKSNSLPCKRGCRFRVRSRTAPPAAPRWRR